MQSHTYEHKHYHRSNGCKFENIRKHIEERIIRIAKSRNCKTCGQRQERTLDNCKHRKPKRRFAKIKRRFGKINRRFLQIKRRFFGKNWRFFSERLALSISGLREYAKKTAFFQKKSPFFFGKSSCFFGLFQTWLFPKEDLLLSGVLSSAAKAFRPVFFVKSADCNAF